MALSSSAALRNPTASTSSAAPPRRSPLPSRAAIRSVPPPPRSSLSTPTQGTPGPAVVPPPLPRAEHVTLDESELVADDTVVTNPDFGTCSRTEPPPPAISSARARSRVWRALVVAACVIVGAGSALAIGAQRKHSAAPTTIAAAKAPSARAQNVSKPTLASGHRAVVRPTAASRSTNAHHPSAHASADKKKTSPSLHASSARVQHSATKNARPKSVAKNSKHSQPKSKRKGAHAQSGTKPKHVAH